MRATLIVVVGVCWFIFGAPSAGQAVRAPEPPDVECRSEFIGFTYDYVEPLEAPDPPASRQETLADHARGHHLSSPLRHPVTAYRPEAIRDNMAHYVRRASDGRVIEVVTLYRRSYGWVVAHTRECG